MEHGIGGLPEPQGRMCQVSGVSFIFDTSLSLFNPNVTGSGRILDMVITSVTPPNQIISNGAVVGDPNETIQVVTLDFLLTGGDDYLFPMKTGNAANITLDAGSLSSFAVVGSEQDALAEYLLHFFNASNPYNQSDTDRTGDKRIIDVAFSSVNFPTASPTARSAIATPTSTPLNTGVAPIAPSNTNINTPSLSITNTPTISPATSIPAPVNLGSVAPTASNDKEQEDAGVSSQKGYGMMSMMAKSKESKDEKTKMKGKGMNRGGKGKKTRYHL